MADWRDGNDPKPARKPTVNKPRPVAKPSVESAVSNPPAASKSTDWRGRSSGNSAPASDAGQRAGSAWMAGETAPVVIRGVRRRLFLIVASIALPLLGIYLIRVVFTAQAKLPLLIATPWKYEARELIEVPYGKHAQKLFNETNHDNIRLANDSSVAEQLLDNILQGSDWQKKYITEFKFKGNKLMGGGPNGDLVCFFISGYITSDHEDHNPTVQLVSTGGNPFANKNSKPAVEVVAVLTSILGAVDPSARVWVALDVHPAPLIANFGDLQIPLHKTIDKWFSTLPEKDKNRLIVTLPCTDGQENWGAPELGSSVFAHFYRLCMSGQFDETATMKDNSVTLEEMRIELNKQVDQWVRNRRFARQQPVWIYSANTKEKANSIEVVSTNGAPRSPEAPHANSLRDFLKDVNNSWDEVYALRAPYRWAPIEYGIAEAQLIHFQDLLETADNLADLSPVKSELDKALANLKKAQLKPPPVSLIEQQMADEYLQDNQLVNTAFANEHERWLRNPPWPIPGQEASPVTATPIQSTGNIGAKPKSEPAIDSKKDAATAGENTASKPSPVSQKSQPDEWSQWTPDQRCQFIVYTLQKRATQADDLLWESSFNLPGLKWLVDKCDTSNKWLEIRLLHLLVEELDWENTDALTQQQRCHACAAVWRAFCELQALSSHPRTELSWWLRQRLHAADSDFHAVVDLLIGAQYKQAFQKSQLLQASLDKLQADSQLLAEAMELRDRAFWVTPHLLNWYIHNYRFSDKSAQLKTELTTLGQAVNVAHDLSNQLTPSGSTDASSRDGLMGSIRESKHRLEQYLNIDLGKYKADISDLSQSAAANPQTIRRLRIAIRSPLIDNATREKFSRWIADYFSQQTDNNSPDFQTGQSDLIENEIRPALESFCNEIHSPKYQAFYKGLCYGDQRLTSWNTTGPAPTVQADSLQWIYNASIDARQLALSFGSHDSYRTQDTLKELPWIAPHDFLVLSNARQRQVQVERLAHAAWGDGDLDNISSPSQLYFNERASQYLTTIRETPQAPDARTSPPSQVISNKQPANEVIANLAQSMLNDASQTLEISSKQIMALKLDFEDETDVIPVNSKSHSIKLKLAGGPRQAQPVLYVDKDVPGPMRTRSRSKGLASQESTKQVTSLLVYLKDNKDSFQFSADASQVGNRHLYLAFRGNFNSRLLTTDNIRSAEDQVVEFKRKQSVPPSITVKHRSQRTSKVIVMLDCSASMQSKVDDISTPGLKVEAFVQAKKTTKTIIEVLKNINQSHPLEVGLVLYGIRADESGGLVREKNGNYKSQILYSQKVSQDFETMAADVMQIKEELGCTPLYPAILRAIKLAEGEPALMYVVSDGFNYYAPSGSYDGPRTTANEVETELRRPGSGHLLNIFQFKNSEFLKVNHSEEEIVRNQAELTRLGDHFANKESFAEIETEILKMLPQSKVYIYNAKSQQIGEGLFGQELKLSLSAEDLPLKVRVKAEVSGTSAVKTSQDQTVDLVGNEKLQLEFTEGQHLAFIPASKDPLAVTQSNSARAVGTSKRGLQLDLVARPSIQFESNGGLLTSSLKGKKDTLSFAVSLVRAGDETEKHTPRPLLILGRLSEKNQSDSHDILVADADMKSSHYPMIELPRFNWRRDSGGDPYQANLTLWLGFDKVDFRGAPAVILADGQEKRVDELGATMLRQGQNITVVLPKAQSDSKRVFVICDQAERTTRRYSEQNHNESHEFTLFDSAKSQPVAVQLVTVEQVESAVNNNKLAEIKFENLSVVK